MHTLETFAARTAVARVNVAVRCDSSGRRLDALDGAGPWAKGLLLQAGGAAFSYVGHSSTRHECEESARAMKLTWPMFLVGEETTEDASPSASDAWSGCLPIMEDTDDDESDRSSCPAGMMASKGGREWRVEWEKERETSRGRRGRKKRGEEERRGRGGREPCGLLKLGCGLRRAC